MVLGDRMLIWDGIGGENMDFRCKPLSPSGQGWFPATIPLQPPCGTRKLHLALSKARNLFLQRYSQIFTKPAHKPWTGLVLGIPDIALERGLGKRGPDIPLQRLPCKYLLWPLPWRNCFLVPANEELLKYSCLMLCWMALMYCRLFVQLENVLVDKDFYMVSRPFLKYGKFSSSEGGF